MLKIGCVTRNIVPSRPAMLQGQMHVRVAKTAVDPLLTTALAIEGVRPDGTPDCTIIVSLDVAIITAKLVDGVRAGVTKRLPTIAADKIVLTATHTHTSLVFLEGPYPETEGAMTPKECLTFLIEKATDAAVAAWEARVPSKLARGFGHAVVAHNRRPVYASGDAQMYGQAARKDFRWIEGPEDHTVDLFFIWGPSGKLAGLMIDIPCPAQVVEGLNEFSADFWHEIRVEVAARFGADVWVFPMCGAAGDQSPHFIFDKKQELEMQARRGVTERQEIAIRVCDAVQRTLACTPKPEGDVVVMKAMRSVTLPPRTISKKDRDWSEAEHARAITRFPPTSWWPTRLKGVVETYDGKQIADPVTIELHTVRLGDAVIVTSPFELFTDYGYQIKARSAAAQTFYSQLTGAFGLYLPTERGADGGGYGAMAVVSIVGPDGGQILVEQSVEAIAALFPK